MNLSLLILAFVFVLIAARRVGRVRVRIWQAMASGAAAVLLTGQIGPMQAIKAIDPEVMLFLFGMFVVGQALVASGYLYALAYHVFSPARSTGTMVLTVLFGGGLASALLMNDTLAIVGTPLVLRLVREHGLDETLMLLALAFGVTLGSQLISNVPFVALYLPLLEQAGGNQADFLALAAGSTLAGNLLILGAVSNVIIIQHAEKHGAALGFFQFARVGIPLTAINLAVYWGWLGWVCGGLGRIVRPGFAATYQRPRRAWGGRSRSLGRCRSPFPAGFGCVHQSPRLRRRSCGQTPGPGR